MPAKMILISKTYEVVTPESAEDGECADSGFLTECEPVTFRELVRLMEDHPNASCWRPTGDVMEWVSSHPEQDFTDCSETTTSVHFHRSNPPRAQKYWRMAMRASGILK